MRRIFGAEFETPVRHPCLPRDPCISRLSSRATACILLPVLSNAESVSRQPNVSNVVPDHAEDLEVPETGGWVLIASDPMGVLVDADGIFGATSLKTVPDLKEAICVRIPCGRGFLCMHNYRGLCSSAAPARPRSPARFPMPVPAAVCPRARAARAAPLEYRRVRVRVARDSGWLCTRPIGRRAHRSGRRADTIPRAGCGVYTGWCLPASARSTGRTHQVPAGIRACCARQRLATHALPSGGAHVGAGAIRRAACIVWCLAASERSTGCTPRVRFRNFGISEFRNFGISEFRNFGISEFRNFGISEFRKFGISEFRNLGIPEFYEFGNFRNLGI
jgi:hypothetical protein